MPFKNGSKLCICEICTCGRHHCPHRPAHRGPLGECVITEYANQYVPHRFEPVTSCKPTAQAIKSEGPISDKTTHRIDYVPHPLERPFVHHPDGYKPAEGDMETTTMYKKDYTEKKADRLPPAKRDATRLVPARFEGEPTYRSDYRKWAISPPERCHTVPAWSPPRTAFEGLPTYTTDYVSHRMAPTTSCKPEQTALQSNAPFDGMTDYRQSYIAYPLGAKPIKERTVWVKPVAPFDGLSVFQRDYTPKEGGRSDTCKPTAQAFQSGAPLQSDTTHRLDYKPWEVARPAHHQPDAYHAPQGDMEMGTTYTKDYPQHPLARAQAVKPKVAGRAVGPFEGTTDYRDSYRRWDVGRRRTMGPHSAYQAPTVPFEGQSTHQAHFIQHPLDMRRSFKPDPRAHLSEQPFDDGTIYRLEYTAKQVEPCPAAILDTRSSAYIYREQDDTGHKFYERSAGATQLLSSSVGNLRTATATAGMRPLLAVA